MAEKVDKRVVDVIVEGPSSLLLGFQFQPLREPCFDTVLRANSLRRIIFENGHEGTWALPSKNAIFLSPSSYGSCRRFPSILVVQAVKRQLVGGLRVGCSVLSHLMRQSRNLGLESSSSGTRMALSEENAVNKRSLPLRRNGRC